ncbi:hypothetical protein ACQP2P_42150 [Dactylosporangium sp. CA-139114]|uniref:hypothetical protein n=1 Tax=Dactylosporangium sp. CA-139114 TaxID=3239931 RepID=UPI003D972E50
MAVERVFPVRDTPDGPAVALRWIGTTWLERGPRYRRRRALTAAAAVLGTLGGAAATVWMLSGAAAHASSRGEEVVGYLYAALVVPGVFWGRHWLRHVPTRERDAGRGLIVGGPVLVVLLPLAVGFGLAVVPRLFGAQYPGEERARRATLELRGVDLGGLPSGSSGTPS